MERLYQQNMTEGVRNQPASWLHEVTRRTGGISSRSQPWRGARDCVGLWRIIISAQRKIIVYIATSVDGYIAKPDGNVEWLNRRPHTIDYGMKAFYPTIDTILWGRKTYEWVLAYYKKKDVAGAMFDTSLANYVFSRTRPEEMVPGVEFVSEPVKTFAQRLRTTPGKHIWIMGGGSLIASFLDANEIDEFDIHVIPTFIGHGIPLIAPSDRDVALRLLSAKRYPDGVVRLRYVVESKLSE